MQSLALILVLGAPSKQKVCKVFLLGLMLTYMRDILVNQKKFDETEKEKELKNAQSEKIKNKNKQ